MLRSRRIPHFSAELKDAVSWRMQRSFAGSATISSCRRLKTSRHRRHLARFCPRLLLLFLPTHCKPTAQPKAQRRSPSYYSLSPSFSVIIISLQLSQLSSLHSTSITKLSHQVAAAAIAKRKATTSSTSQNKHHLSLAQLGSSACGLLTHISLVLHLASWLIPPH